MKLAKYLIAFFLLFALWHSDVFAAERGTLLYLTASAKQAVTQTISAIQTAMASVTG